MTRASYSATPLLRSLVHRPQGVILVCRYLSLLGTFRTLHSAASVSWYLKVGPQSYNYIHFCCDSYIVMF